MSHIVLRPTRDLRFDILDESGVTVGESVAESIALLPKYTVTIGTEVFADRYELAALEHFYGPGLTYEIDTPSDSNDYSVFLKFAQIERTAVAERNVAALQGIQLGNEMFRAAIENPEDGLLEVTLCHYARFEAWGNRSRLIPIRSWTPEQGIRNIYVRARQ
jgi:hypothetical protein